MLRQISALSAHDICMKFIYNFFFKRKKEKLSKGSQSTCKRNDRLEFHFL